jgi:hypothetical protein
MSKETTLSPAERYQSVRTWGISCSKVDAINNTVIQNNKPHPVEVQIPSGPVPNTAHPIEIPSGPVPEHSDFSLIGQNMASINVNTPNAVSGYQSVQQVSLQQLETAGTVQVNYVIGSTGWVGGGGGGSGVTSGVIQTYPNTWITGGTTPTQPQQSLQQLGWVDSGMYFPNVAYPQLSFAPAIPHGARWRDPVDKKWKVWNGVSWEQEPEPEVELPVPDPTVKPRRKFGFVDSGTGVGPEAVPA